MKRLRSFIIVITLLGGGVYFYLQENGLSIESISNTPSSILLSASCGNIENLLLKSTVSLTVSNNSNRDFNNVQVGITAYDNKGNVIKQKTTRFLRTLLSSSSMSKPIVIPARSKSCDCVIINSEEVN